MPGNLSQLQVTAETLTRDVIKGRGHAYLISGSSGPDLQDAAKIITAVLLCSGEDAPCGVCLSCRRIETGMHPDLRLLEAAGGSIGIGLIRELKPFFSLPARESKVKIILIHGADCLTREAANSLLRGMEEPHPDLVFILTSQRPAAVLATISSRCRRYSLLPSSRDQVLRQLRERSETEGEVFDVGLAAAVAGYYPGKAREIMADKAWQQSYIDARNLMEQILLRKESRWQSSRQLQEMDAEQQQQVLLLMAYLFRDIGVVATGNKRDVLACSCLNWTEGLAPKITTSAAVTAALHLLQGRVKFQENTNRQLQAEALLVKLYGLINRSDKN